MTANHYFPTALILLNIGAAVMYCPQNWRKVAFYTAAAVINFVASF